jgi:uncharacterized protein
VESPSDPSPPVPPAPPVLAPVRAPGHPFGFFVALVLLYLVPGAASQVVSPIAGLAWTQIFVFLVPALVSVTGSNLALPRALLLDRPPPRGALALSYLVGFVGFLVAGATMALVSALLPAAWVRTFDLTRLFQGPASERYALAAIAALVAPICEEVAFRGHLLPLLGRRLRPGAAIAVSALLFALLHLDPVRFTAVLLLGVVFGWLAWRAGSLWPSIAAHAVNNAIGAFLVTSSSAAGAASQRSDPRASLAALTLGLALLLPLLSWYRRLTPDPRPLGAAVVLANPADPDLRFRLRRVPPTLQGLVWAGCAALLAIAAGRVLAR